jgi:phosphoglycerol transferase MdoB-like AlkP superfamily enzyme
MRIALIFVIAVLLSFAADALSLPRAPWRRAPLAFAGHILSVLFLYALFMLLSARPIFSALCLVGLLASMSSLSNPKFATLREPFVFSDLCLYTQVFRYPRFYLPFADIRVTIASGVAVLMLALFCWAEPPVTPHPWLIPLLVMVACVTCGYLMLTYLPLTLDVATDQRRYGFFTVFVAYLLYGLHPSTMRNFRAQVQASPFADDDNAPTHSLQARPSNLVSTAEATDGTNMLPDVIVIQSESYFDARRVSAAIDPSAYTQLDRACSESVVWGKLTVPAWGANTMRSEFSFLTGVASKKLGSARFYPYVFLRRACASLPGWLQRRGYRTLAIHPFHAQFFRRDRVFKQLHFDDFLDISHFEKAPHAGPYVADAAVADAILAALEDGSAQQPMPRFCLLYPVCR